MQPTVKQKNALMHLVRSPWGAGIGMLAAFLVGYLLRPFIRQNLFGISFVSSGTTVRQQNQYKLISPLLLCNGINSQNFSDYAKLKAQLSAYISQQLGQPGVQNISVYFRDTNSRWIGINENQGYAPGSMLKVPLMIAYYKWDEARAGILQQSLTYDGSFDFNTDETFKPAAAIKPGTYSAEQLIQYMIKDSDNNATAILFDHIDKNFLSGVFTDLGLTIPPDNDPSNTSVISAAQYSYFFRILYNATYLSEEHSEQALELLTQADFPQGLRQSIPQNVTVAQKFGERTVMDQNHAVLDRELHNCGIVYAKDKPYFLCVMTRGADFNVLTQIIQRISAITYQDMIGKQ